MKALFTDNLVEKNTQNFRLILFGILLAGFGIFLLQSLQTVSASTVNCSDYGTFKAGNWPGRCWRPLADNSPFNTWLPVNPTLVPNSAATVQRVLGFGSLQNSSTPNVTPSNPQSTKDFTKPTYWSQSTDPLYKIHCTEAWGTCAVEGLSIRIPSGALPAGGGDGHMTVIDQSTDTEYNFWQASKPASGVLNIGWGGKTSIKGGGVGGGAAVAANYASSAGMIREEEMEANNIDHALFMVVYCDSGSYVYPAIKSGRSCASIGLSNINAPAMGTHFRLNMTDTEINALNVPTYRKNVLRAMARYGMYVGDTGSGSWAMQFESPTMYTSLGYPNKWTSLAQKWGVPYYSPDNAYVWDLRSGVDWTNRLQVVDPCVAKRTCL